jgi:PIN domain nuclease of toxin-antitoxin system
VRLLLDTHVLLWTLLDRSRLSAGTLASIRDPENAVLVSAASPWEIEVKRAKGELEVPTDLRAAIHEASFTALPITIEHGIAAGRLPLHHRDPFDRMLVAQAQLEGLTIVTRDAALARYQVAILPA